ncbi:Rossmann-like and DUF2520 domain-containing protein [Noviherbaspirillum aridicola]|uniref:Short-subunit dehydrogenase-like oxidoreductase (DUF2520 family) n=1 Tax=Noviherbaspirillum aridicola TaxID=2849687 RepID=A0ABQ4Q2B3_9BURK|nr:Rossmann-like and DUF2520 domain-containing protein [Noviherbaspirillum aridicola]GIZ51171.1 hypothetical protein NCCP691_11850 [Noviherbaspirillum aridicola]
MPRTLNIIGGGKVGMTLGRLWAAGGSLAPIQICNRSPESARQAAAFIGAGAPVDTLDQMEPADVWMLAVPDDALPAVAAALAGAGTVSEGAVVFHCSGALSSEVLAPLARLGAACASVHPIRSFADPAQAAVAFDGTFCGIEGDARALALLEPAFTDIGGRCVAVDARHKTVYHAAAVFASNYLVTLLDVAQHAYQKAGVDPDHALRMLEPLVRGTVDNVFRAGTTQALTGPIARGDLGTAVRQYRAVKDWDEQYGNLYKQMAKLTADIARRRRSG